MPYLSLILLTFLIFSRPAAAQTAAGSLSDVGTGRYWKLLLHFRGGRSEAAGRDFFLSPKGGRDPVAELAADVAAFENPSAARVGPLKQNPQCAFPERFRFVKEALHLNVPAQACPEFKKWKASLDIKSVTVVFAAPYMGSPASMFGHTFLRLDAPRSDLLDYVVSFEAVTGPDPGPEYVVKGLIGSYPGMFSLAPYYLKIDTYSDIESRDLLEYRLDLNPEQISRLLNHVWEMGSTYFDYYFFNRNCSYQLLSLLEVANPRWHLRERFGPMTVPSDTIRALYDAGAVAAAEDRPSLISRLKERLRNMSESEREDFYRDRGNSSRLSGRETAATLDALLDWNKYRAMNESKTIFDAAPAAQIDKKLLAARIKARAETEPQDLPAGDSQPSAQQAEAARDAILEAHGSSKISLFAAEENGAALEGFEFRPVYHDLLDPDEGYLAGSVLTLARTRASLIEDPSGRSVKARLDDFTAAEVVNLAPMSALVKPLSWRIGGGLFHPDDTALTDALGGHVKAGAGATVPLASGSVVTALIYGLADVNVEASNAFTDSYQSVLRYGPEGEAGVLGSFGPRWKAQIAYEPFWFFSPAGTSGRYTKISAVLGRSWLPWEFRVRSEFFILQNFSYDRIVGQFSRYF